MVNRESNIIAVRRVPLLEWDVNPTHPFAFGQLIAEINDSPRKKLIEDEIQRLAHFSTDELLTLVQQGRATLLRVEGTAKDGRPLCREVHPKTLNSIPDSIIADLPLWPLLQVADPRQ